MQRDPNLLTDDPDSYKEQPGQGFAARRGRGDGAGVFVAQGVKAGGAQRLLLPRMRFTSATQVSESSLVG